MAEEQQKIDDVIQTSKPELQMHIHAILSWENECLYLVKSLRIACEPENGKLCLYTLIIGHKCKALDISVFA